VRYILAAMFLSVACGADATGSIPPGNDAEEAKVNYSTPAEIAISRLNAEIEHFRADEVAGSACLEKFQRAGVKCINDCDAEIQGYEIRAFLDPDMKECKIVACVCEDGTTREIEAESE